MVSVATNQCLYGIVPVDFVVFVPHEHPNAVLHAPDWVEKEREMAY